MLQVTSHELLAQLTTLIADATSLKNPQLVLFTNPSPLLGPNIAVGDLVLPTFTGYAPVSPAAWGTPFVNASGQAEVLGPATPFVCTGSGALNTITGAALLDTAGTHIIFADNFAVPIPIQNLGDGFVYIPRYAMGSGS